MIGTTNARTLGGGGALRFQFGQALPTEVVAGCIFVISDVALGPIIVSQEQPATPTEGMLWLQAEADSANPTQGTEMSPPAKAMAYRDGQWQNREAYYALFDQWKRFSRAITLMGYEWSYASPSPLLTRLGAAEGLTATPAVGAVAGYSDFDDMPIFKDIRRCNLAASGAVSAYQGDPAYKEDGTGGDVMVEIPQFWYKAEVDTGAKKRRFWIADAQAEGFALHPLFDRGGGVVKNKAYVGAYEMGAGYSSKSGVAPLVNLTRTAFRTGAKAKGAGWGLEDLAARQAITELMRIEFATHNIQAALGKGNSATAAALATGRTDGLVGFAGREAGADGATSVMWRGMENPYGNVWKWMDGLNVNSGTFYYCLDPSQYADETAANYTALSYAAPATLSGSYATALGFDASAPWAGLPCECTGGSETTYLTDACYSSSGWRNAIAGGAWESGGICGLAAWHWTYNAASGSNIALGSRLAYLPA